MPQTDRQEREHCTRNGQPRSARFCIYLGRSRRVLTRQRELREQGSGIEGDIAHAQRKLEDIAQERAFYQRQMARGKMIENEFGTRMAETEQDRDHWEEEMGRLKQLRDDQQKVGAGLDYALRLMATLHSNLDGIDQGLDELLALPEDKQTEVLKERQRIVRAVVDEVIDRQTAL